MLLSSLLIKLRLMRHDYMQSERHSTKRERGEGRGERGEGRGERGEGRKTMRKRKMNLNIVTFFCFVM